MIAQADSELAGAYGYVPWIEGCPNNSRETGNGSISSKMNAAMRKLVYDLLDTFRS